MATTEYTVHHNSMNPVCPSCKSKLMYSGRDDLTVITRMKFKCGSIYVMNHRDAWTVDTKCPFENILGLKKDELYPPPRCPFCGSFNAGGGQHSARYDCGSHIWIERTPDRPMIQGSLIMKGHEGECTKINKERNQNNGTNKSTT